MAQPRKLGRGLGSLLSTRHGQDEAAQPAEGRVWAALEDLRPSQEQPRRDFERGLNGLAESLRRHGMMQPILVTLAPDGKYEILAGERRWRAARIAGLKQVPIMVRQGTESPGERLELALIENIQREDLNPIERAQACTRLVEEHGYTQDLVADRLGYQRSTVSNLMRLLELPESLQADVSRETLSAGHARALLQLQGTPLQAEARKRVLDEGLSVRQTEQLCKEWSKSGASAKHRARPRKPAWVVDLQEKVSRRLGVRTELLLLTKGGGKLILHFQDLDQLDQMTQRLGGTSEASELLEG
jgi:ParB family chromosome partitioning protein